MGWQDKQWNSLLNSLQSIFLRSDKNKSDNTFEHDGLKLLWPVLEPCIEKDVNSWPWIPSCYGNYPFETGSFGFFLYEISSTESNERQINLHMGNILAPKSPFMNLKDRKGELAQLLEDAFTREPQIKYIISDSWLNSFKTFQDLFPYEWQKDATPSLLSYTYNWWGQFVSRRGNYHKRNGDYLRKTGKFPYLSQICSCSITSFRDHLSLEA